MKGCSRLFHNSKCGGNPSISATKGRFETVSRNWHSTIATYLGRLVNRAPSWCHKHCRISSQNSYQERRIMAIGRLLARAFALPTFADYVARLVESGEIDTALDIGCGEKSPLSGFRPRIRTVGIDAF